MFELKVIQHAKISKKELNEIITIKSAAWPYPYEKQLEWLNSNLKEFDLHLILLKSNNSVAYLNLNDIELEIDNKPFKAFGVGNVCAIEKGKGYGNELMKKTNQYIIEKKRIGLLFCKKELVNFYVKFNWKLVDKKKLYLTFENCDIQTMILKKNHLVSSLKYNGKAF